MEKRLTFAYGRALIVSRFMVLGALVVSASVGIAVLPPLSPGLVAVPAALLAVYFLLFAVSPLLTDHWLTRSRLVLRQGWYFRVVLPLSDVEDIQLVDHASPGQIPLGIHRPLGRSVLYATGARTGLVSVRLRSPRRFWQSFGLPATEIVFDVRQPTQLIEAIEERRRLLAPVEPDRPDA